jgi:hypothetical protein
VRANQQNDGCQEVKYPKSHNAVPATKMAHPAMTVLLMLSLGALPNYLDFFGR